MARVAQARGAMFTKRHGHLWAADATSARLLGEAVHDVARSLAFPSAQHYIRATPAERYAAMRRKFLELHPE